MRICRKPTCAEEATTTLGFCAADHAAYLLERRAWSELADAAQEHHGDAFALIAKPYRQRLAENLVGTASEGLPQLPAGTPEAAGLIATALIAAGADRTPDATRIARRRDCDEQLVSFTTDRRP